jgi:hydroxyacylglutathione hydrolase
MNIKQFEDKHLSHYSYAILNENEKEIILIDPARNPQPYYDYAKENHALITGIIETHPHADFVSSHLEICQTTGAKIYAHSLTGAAYPFQAFDEGDTISLGKNITLRSLHTPGHSPDSICVVLEHEGKDKAVFTGDTLFIGDCGRPDLREEVGNMKAQREELARQMYYSLRTKLMVLLNDVVVYPAHGAGTLCGKALSSDNSSTIGAEKVSNWSLQDSTEQNFIANLIAEQPFIPKYFPFDVELNRKGAPAFKQAIEEVVILKSPSAEALDPKIIVIDTRPQEIFKAGHLPNSFNIQSGNKFETWLGSIINPGEKFYLNADNHQELNHLISRTASIGYEEFIEAAFVSQEAHQYMESLDLKEFTLHPERYTILDIRNTSETKAQPIFADAVNIPLAALREAENIPLDKPIVVHCAGGYRSAAGSSILKSMLSGDVKVYDLGEHVSKFH